MAADNVTACLQPSLCQSDISLSLSINVYTQNVLKCVLNLSIYNGLTQFLLCVLIVFPLVFTFLKKSN
jgi:hypothetical protein